MSTSSKLQRGQLGAVNKGCLIALVVGLVVGIFAWKLTGGTYNKLVAADEVVEKQWAGLDAAYKRRLDVIPQLVGVVEGAADFESDTYLAVTEARAKVNQAPSLGEAPTDPAELEAYMAAQSNLGASLGRLLVTMEAYPALKATDAFRDLQSQVEGSENRIAVARGDYINAVAAYNTAIRKFPANFIAGMYDFERRPQLQEQDSAAVRETPVIDMTDD
ncbi:MAG: hypothetical protein DHS20C15_27970 [Planctomycetota bacterium]|nr:MAG: hypothetical protein DHS20C15_27970 [Planctomycetota bacterium]